MELRAASVSAQSGTAFQNAVSTKVPCTAGIFQNLATRADQAPHKLTMEISTSDTHIEWACNVLRGLTNEDIDRHGPVVDTVLERIGPLRGWAEKSRMLPEKESRMLTAEELLDKMLSTIGTTRRLLDRALPELVLDHIRETQPTGDPRLAFASPGRKASQMDLLLHGFCIRAHAMACNGAHIDHLARASNPEVCFDGNIPAYSEKNQLDQKTMKRCIGRYSRVQFLISEANGEEGIFLVASPVIVDFSRISYEELRRAGQKLLEEKQYSLLMKTAKELSRCPDKCQKVFDYSIGESLKNVYDLG